MYEWIYDMRGVRVSVKWWDEEPTDVCSSHKNKREEGPAYSYYDVRVNGDFYDGLDGETWPSLLQNVEDLLREDGRWDAADALLEYRRLPLEGV
jgi:hypothetical protein